MTFDPTDSFNATVGPNGFCSGDGLVTVHSVPDSSDASFVGSDIVGTVDVKVTGGAV